MFIIGIILCFLQLSESKELFISYSAENMAVELFKYFNSAQNQFYVDISANDPIYSSKTANLLGWNGLNIEADTQKHMNFIVSRPHQTNLNMAVNDLTNGNASSKVQKTTLANLCHQYYPKRPKLINLGLSGEVVSILNSNDWKDTKCQPQVIQIESNSDETYGINIRELLNKLQYSVQKETKSSQIYIRKQLVSIYKKEQQKGQKLLENVIIKEWIPIYEQIFKIIVPQFDTKSQNFKHIDPRTSPIYLHFASQKIISVQKLKTTSQILSTNTRPILITHFNNLKSKLYLGIQNYKITEIKLKSTDSSLFHIQISYPWEKLQLYVLNHDLNGQKLNILDRQLEQAIRCPGQKYLIHQKVVNSDNYIGG